MFCLCFCFSVLYLHAGIYFGAGCVCLSSTTAGGGGGISTTVASAGNVRCSFTKPQQHVTLSHLDFMHIAMSPPRAAHIMVTAVASSPRLNAFMFMYV